MKRLEAHDKIRPYNHYSRREAAKLLGCPKSVIEEAITQQRLMLVRVPGYLRGRLQGAQLIEFAKVLHAAQQQGQPAQGNAAQAGR